jgi:single-strand DNA-binding protein
MSKGINKVILIGRLGNDPDVRYSASGAPIANISIATSFSRKDAQTDQWVDETEWHKVVMFSRLAEVAGQYLRKGSQVYIEGRLQTRKWQDRDGHDRYTTEIIANDMQMLGGRSEGSAAYGSSSDANNYAPPAADSNPQATPASRASAGAPPVINDFDDDIPF